MRLQLRRAGRRLRQGSDNGSPGEFDLKVVLSLPPRIAQNRVTCSAKSRLIRCGSDQRRLCGRIAPGLMRNSAQRYARICNFSAVNSQSNGDRDERKGVREPLAKF